MKNSPWLIVGAICAISLLILSFIAIDIITVKGNFVAKETWEDGVDPNPYQPKTYFLIPGWSQHMYTYDLSSQVFVMNNTPTHEEKQYKGREKDAYQVQSSEGQDMWISLNVRWRIDPEKVVHLHKTIRDHFEEKLIRPAVMLIVKNEATRRTAIEAFSGDGLVKLQTDIMKDLMNPEGELRQRGIVVENFVIEGIKLDEKYIGEIRARQVATQQKLRADEETKASNAMALKAQAEAKADYNKRVVEAERDKAVGILKAEELAQKQVLAAKADAERVTVAAEADKRRNILAAEGDKESGLLRAQAIEAIGKAEAEATKLKLTAYAAPGSEMFVRAEIARHMSGAFGNIKGFLPSDMRITVLSENFMQSIETMMGAKQPPATPAK